MKQVASVCIICLTSFGTSGCSQPGGPTEKTAVNAKDEMGHPSAWYSGEFRCLSHFAEVVQLDPWSGFGFAGPTDGTLAPEAEADTSFPKLDRIPGTTTVKWRSKSSSETREQTLTLGGVIPPNTEGITIFELDREGVWHVKFEPGVVP